MGLEELYAPRPMFLGLLPPFSQEQSVVRGQMGETAEEGSAGGKTPPEAEEVGRNLSSSLLHLLVLQVCYKCHYNTV